MNNLFDCDCGQSFPKVCPSAVTVCSSGVATQNKGEERKLGGCRPLGR